MLQVAVINESQAITDDEVEAYLPVFTAQWNNDLASIWPVVPSQFLFFAEEHPTRGRQLVGGLFRRQRSSS